MENKTLIKIIKDKYNVDITKKSRASILPALRAIYSRILHERGHKLTFIARGINRHHTTVMYYINNYEKVTAYYSDTLNAYEYCISEFIKQVGDTDNEWIEKMSVYDLKKEHKALKSKYNILLLENQSLKIEQERTKVDEKNYERLFNIIRQKLKPNTEELVIKKLHHLFNGI